MTHSLADRYQAAKAVQAKADAEVEALKLEILATGEKTLEGQRCTIKVTPTKTDSLTKTMLVAEFGAAWFEARRKVLDGVRVTVTAKAMQTLVKAAIDEIAA